MFSRQRNNYVLDERPSTSATATTSTPSPPANHETPADDGMFCLETFPLPIFTKIRTIFTVTTSICSL